MSEEKDKPEEDSDSEEVEVVEEKTLVRRFDPQALAQGTGEQRDDDDAITSMTCTEIGFSITHPT